MEVMLHALLNLEIDWNSVVSFKLLLLYTWVKVPDDHSERRLGGPQIQFGYGDEREFLFFPRIEPRSSSTYALTLLQRNLCKVIV
jgi:hypothetical protein